jgi:hypothetical protein
MKSLDIFNLATLEIFRKCLSNIPQPVKLDPSEIGKEVAGYFSNPNNAAELFTQLSVIQDKCEETINWLRNEGFLRIEPESLRGPVTATLTHKGMNASSVSVPSLGEGRRFSDFMTSNIKDVTKNIVSTLIAGLFTSGS